MQTCRQYTNADEYIRRIDRMVFVTALITAALAASLFL